MVAAGICGPGGGGAAVRGAAAVGPLAAGGAGPPARRRLAAGLAARAPPGVLAALGRQPARQAGAPLLLPASCILHSAGRPGIDIVYHLHMSRQQTKHAA